MHEGQNCRPCDEGSMRFLLSSPYHARSQMHRPTDGAALSIEVRRLARGGLTAVDISTALRIQLPQVIEMLAGRLVS
jgi:hypothetical protein